MASTTEAKRTGLILLALFAGGAVPIQVITLSFGYAQYVKGLAKGPEMMMAAHQFAAWYVPLVYIPALVILLGITLYAKNRYPHIFRRIVVGFGVGALSTVALDFFRQMGVIYHWLPGDTPFLFGKMITASNTFAVFYPIGFLVHFLNGANFGLFYTFVWGKQRSYGRGIFWSIIWLLIVELGMMTLPPMGPMVGLFGVQYQWPQLFLLTLVAHIAFGVVLGILTQFYLKGEVRGPLWRFLNGGSGRRRTG